MKEIREIRVCSECGEEFEVVRHPVTQCPHCMEDENYAQWKTARTHWHSVLSWIAIICGLTGMVLSLLTYLNS